MFRIAVAVAVLGLLAVATALPVPSVEGIINGPVHASCKMSVDISSSCADSLSALQTAVSDLSGTDCTGKGEKCLYIMGKASATELTAIHETPSKHYKDDLTFTAASEDGASCTLDAFSTSETWYAHLDFGTNYCNLHNLLEQSKLNFTETVSDSTCTQYSTADCTKY